MQTLSLILLLNLFVVTLSTRLFLQSQSSDLQISHTCTEIPQLHSHRFSCQLVFFNVYNNYFIANLTQIPKGISNTTLSLFTYQNDQIQNNIKYKNTSFVINNTAIFEVNLTSMSRQQNFQIIMGFNISYDAILQQQQRKAYMLFTKDNSKSYIVKLPNKTIIVTQVIGLALILILPWNVQYRKYLPLTFNIFYCFIYICILFVALYLQIIFGTNNIIYQFQRFFVGMFELLCLVMYSQDIMMFLTQRNTISFVIGIIFSLAVMICDYFVPTLQDAWFINDIIAVMVAGAFIKFIIIRKMKTSIWALGLLWIFCIIREFAKNIGLQQFDQGLGMRVVPLFLQLPAIDDSSTITCSAFGTSKIIAFGILLNYCKRVDQSLSTHFYRVLVSILTVICITVQLLFNLVILQDLPTIQVGSVILFYPLAVLLMLFFANKRGEWAEIWSGSFYDMAVNRASIPRTVSFEGLESDFGKDLMINGSSGIYSEHEKRNQNKNKQTNIQ